MTAWSAITPTTYVARPRAVMAIAWATVDGRPITSKAWSTPPPVIDTTASGASTCEASTVSVAPSRIAVSSLPADTSMAMIRDAPAMRAPWITLRPTPPQPSTATVSPGRTLATLNTEPSPVTTAQPSSEARSIGMSSGMTTRPRSSTTILSLSAPTLPITVIALRSSVSSRGGPRIGGAWSRDWRSARARRYRTVCTNRSPVRGRSRRDRRRPRW